MRALRVSLCIVMVLAAGPVLFGAGDDLKELQKQLAVVEQLPNPDNAAIAELSRRILEIDPHNQSMWEKRARALLALDDYKRCQETLDAWGHEDKQIPASATDIAGDLAYAQKHYEKALESWTAYLKLQSRDEDTWKNVEQLHELQKHWDKAAAALTKMIAINDSAESRVARARCGMEMRKWDDARADLKKANALDATDTGLKALLPQFEQLDKLLPKIRDLDRKLAGKPQANLLLDRGLLFNAVQLYDLALEDADAALAVAPKSRRAALQKAQALIALTRTDDAAKLRVIVKNNNFSDAALQKIGVLDAQIDAKPGDAALLTARARECSDVEQYALAQEDARAAARLDPKSADALVEEGFATMKLGSSAAAMKEFTTAAELNPKNAVAWRSLGELEMDRANYPAAIDCFSRSLKLHESPLVLQKREECYRNSGHAVEADQDLQRWQKLTPPKK